MAMRKQCFAQCHVLDLLGHRAKYGSTIEEAREFLTANGGGTIKQRNAAVVETSVGSFRSCKVVEEVKL